MDAWVDALVQDEVKEKAIMDSDLAQIRISPRCKSSVGDTPGDDVAAGLADCEARGGSGLAGFRTSVPCSVLYACGFSIHAAGGTK